MTTSPIIAPSILASDFARLAEECAAVLDAGADWLHVDVMDGRFVPNITIGIPVVAALQKHHPDAVLDVHLMIDEPERYVERFVEAGADIVTVHAEATRHLHRTLQAIRAAGARAGVSLNPATPVSALEHVLGDLDLILIMSVNPGFGGQAFIPETLPKLKATRQLLASRGREDDVVLEVDGGVKASNIGAIAAAGANAFVAGSAIFKGELSYRETIQKMREAIQG
ncbi:MAG: ribulose-phosphate 3-epimerase [Myxococcales bacterium]|nr:ribulose-phosphate 3-epimerase [Myxococcales bacterium]